MTTGSGLAVCGIWLAVGLVGHKDGDAACIVAMFAALATMMVALASGK